jgi:heptosyltransferase-3
MRPIHQSKSHQKRDRILIIVRQANGDVLLSSPLINALKEAYPASKIDLLVNESTFSMAEALPNISEIYSYCYSWRKKGFFYRCWKEFELFKKLWGKYDIAVSLTASDRSIFLAIIAGKCSVGMIDREFKKSWWKKKYLDHGYDFDPSVSIIMNNRKPLECLGIQSQKMELKSKVNASLREAMQRKLASLGIKKFVIFHPSARVSYKIYPTSLRNNLLKLLNQENVCVVVTGGASDLDFQIAQELPDLPYIHNFIAQCHSISELIALMDLSEAYIGMDTLNMHLAASLDKPIFAIFGPTNPSIWSPWCNALQRGAGAGAHAVQQYGNVTLFQSTLPCVPCFKAGCDDRGGKSDCLDKISSDFVWSFFMNWWKSNQYCKAEKPLLENTEYV